MKLTNKTYFRIFSFIIVMVLFNGCSNDSERPLVDIENLRVKAFTFQSDFTNDLEEVLLEYDNQGRLYKTINGTNETILLYNDKNQLVDDQNRTYYYNDFGKVHKIFSKFDSDSTLITYNENNLIINETTYSSPYKVITEITYNSENAILETYSYIDLNGNQVLNSYRSFYEYLDNEIVKVTSDNYTIDGVFVNKSFVKYVYSESPHPMRLILKSLNIESSYAFYQITNIFSQITIPLGIYANSHYYPFHSYQQIKSGDEENTYGATREYIYSFDKYVYPSYVKSTYTDTFGRNNVSEYNWEYEEF